MNKIDYRIMYRFADDPTKKERKAVFASKYKTRNFIEEEFREFMDRTRGEVKILIHDVARAGGHEI